MAITLQVIPQDTLVRSGQPMSFMLTVTNTDGATREVTVISPVAVTPGISANFGMISRFDGTVADSGSLVIPFSGVFFASAVPQDSDSISQTFTFKVNVQMEDVDGAITSCNVSDVISMSVVPNIPALPQIEIGQEGMLDFQSNNNTVLGLILGLL